MAIRNLEGLFAGSFFAAGSPTAFIDINVFASDSLLDCLLVYPFGLTHPHTPGDMDFLFDDESKITQGRFSLMLMAYLAFYL
jgi:hypothetical protein